MLESSARTEFSSPATKKLFGIPPGFATKPVSELKHELYSSSIKLGSSVDPARSQS